MYRNVKLTLIDNHTHCQGAPPVPVNLKCGFRSDFRSFTPVSTVSRATLQ